MLGAAEGLLPAAVVRADEPPPLPSAPPRLKPAATPASPFDQPFALGGYSVGWLGAYDGIGIGGRARWEFWQRKLGVEVFGEALAVDWPGGSRHDWPIGFDVYRPFAIGSRVRALPLAGMCAVFSFITPGQEGGPPSNDVIFGLHGGAGLEVGIVGPLTVFVDAQAVWYLGHDRTAKAWSGSVSGAFSQAVVFQPNAGLALAFGR